MSKKKKRAPSGEWLGYPELGLDDIEYESVKSAKYLSQFFVENRKARINLLMENAFYQRFLEVVRKKYGNTSFLNIEKAAREAVEKLIEEVNSK